MNKLITILTLLALMLPMTVLAQPEDGPRERPDRDREFQRDRGERGERGDRPGGDRFRPGDRERDGDRGDRHGKREPLAVEQIGEAIETIRAMHGDAMPPWIERIEKLAEEDPEAAAKALSRFPRIREMMHARKNKPEEFELHAKQSKLMRELLPLVRELKQAQKNNDQNKVDELTPQVRERIEQLFQHRLKFKQIEIQKIRAQLAAAEQELADIQADGEALIDKKMNEILTRTGPQDPREGGPREEGDRPDRRDRPERDERGPKPDRPERDDRPT